MQSSHPRKNQVSDQSIFEQLVGPQLGHQRGHTLTPGRLTAGTYSHHPFRKENDLIQTSMIMFHVILPGCKKTPELLIRKFLSRYHF